MYSIDDILKKLRAGTDIDVIADSFAATLNKAQEVYAAEIKAKEEEEEKRAKAAAAAKEKEAEKRERLLYLRDDVRDFILDFYVDSPEEEEEITAFFSALTADDILEVVDDTSEMVKAFLPCLVSSLKEPEEKKKKIGKNPSIGWQIVTDGPEVEKINRSLSSFLKNMGW